MQCSYRLKYYLYGEEESKMQALLTDEQLQLAIKETARKETALQLQVCCDFGIFPPPDYNMQISADPLETESYTMVSFFSFLRIADKNFTVAELNRIWSPFKALGRVYVADEGVNAQMAIPTNIFEDFKRATKQNELFKESRFNTDPAISKQQYFDTKPFRSLHIRIRDQIVADGLDVELDWHKAGNELDPMEWHKALDDPNAIILDCRNTYETDVGIFQGAIPLNTTFFRESWVALDEVLKGRAKDSETIFFRLNGKNPVVIELLQGRSWVTYKITGDTALENYDLVLASGYKDR